MRPRWLMRGEKIILNLEKRGEDKERREKRESLPQANGEWGGRLGFVLGSSQKQSRNVRSRWLMRLERTILNLGKSWRRQREKRESLLQTNGGWEAD